MLEIKLKGPANLGNLQGPFEASIQNRKTWRTYAENLDKMVQFFGPATMPDDIVRSQVEDFRVEMEKTYSGSTIKLIISSASSFYTWMQHMGFATINPFKNNRIGCMKYNDVRVIA